MHILKKQKEKDYSKWEWDRLETSDLILFWVPRDLEILPGFTTNVEFGRYITLCPEKIILGCPDNAVKMDYIKLLYKRFSFKNIENTLENTIKEALKYI